MIGYNLRVRTNLVVIGMGAMVGLVGAGHIAEAVRTVPYMLAVAPVLFGFVSDSLVGRDASAAAAAGRVASHANGVALCDTFLIMLLPTAIAGVSLLRAVHTYPRDVATAAASSAHLRDKPSRRAGTG